jgi:para-nitrobenzyl esterase
MPVVDGDIIPKPVPELIESGELNDFPCIFGLCAQDIWPYLLYVKAVEWAVMQSEAGRSPVYAYYIDRQLPGDDAPGAFHACDLWYALGTLDRCWRPFTEIDYRISDNMTDYFTSFVKNCNPRTEGLAEWTPIAKNDVKFIRFGDAEAAMYEPPVEELKAAIQNTAKPFPGM